MKTFNVAGHFPEAVAHRAFQQTRVVASTFELAAKRGLAELRRRDGIRGKKLHVVKLTISLVAREERSL